MNRKQFQPYKAQFIQATSKVLAEEHTENLDEAAFPAYSNPNPLMNFLFWERIYRAMQYIAQRGKIQKVMDFGCGSGVMLPFLAQSADEVIAVDVDLAPLRRLEKFIAFPDNITFTETHATVQSGTLDLLLALDVLEHVNALDKLLADLSALLKPDGVLLVSGPTENIFYKMGRMLAGPEYSGHYHVRNIYDIEKNAGKYLKTKRQATLFYPVPLFVIFAGEGL